MKTLSIALILSMLTSMAFANGNSEEFQRVEILKDSLSIKSFIELEPNKFEITLRFNLLANNSCEAKFAGFVKLGINEYVSIYKNTITNSCLKLMQEVEVTQKVNLSFYTKSFPAVESIKINGKVYWLENDFGQLKISTLR